MYKKKHIPPTNMRRYLNIGAIISPQIYKNQRENQRVCWILTTGSDFVFLACIWLKLMFIRGKLTFIYEKPACSS